jgi:NAD-dependent dihydropyrimidine dehydrogenase PreA subunit
MSERIPTSEEYVSFNSKICNGCGRCVKVCPSSIIKLNNKKKAYIYDITRCHECAACFFSCPVQAIEFIYPKGGTGVVYKYG